MLGVRHEHDPAPGSLNYNAHLASNQHQSLCRHVYVPGNKITRFVNACCLLQAWCAYCLMEAASTQQHPLLKEYGVSLDWTDLRHLVLSSKQAKDAAHAVAAYLKTRTRPGQEAFAMRAPSSFGPTLRLAQRFGKDNSKIQTLLAQEQASAKARVAAHWDVVKQKQAKAAEIRSKLVGLRAQLAQLQAVYDAEKAALPSWQYSNDACRAAQSACDRKQNEINSEQRELDNTIKAPPPVFQPLPEGKDAALQVPPTL